MTEYKFRKNKNIVKYYFNRRDIEILREMIVNTNFHSLQYLIESVQY